MTRPHHSRAFSLAETVIALGIVSFALVAILGAFAVGIDTQRVSSNTLRASQLATLILAQRSDAPTDPNLPSALPALDQTYNATPVHTPIGWDGAGANVGDAPYLLSYQVGTNAVTGPNVAQVRIVLSWPAFASPDDPNTDRYEVVTQIPLY